MKIQIKNNFNNAAQKYDVYAHLQRKVAENLFVKFLSSAELNKNISVLDLGCGTGYFTQLFKNNRLSGKIFNLDIAYNMCHLAGHNSICGDLDLLPIKHNSFDYIFSSMSLQWSSNLKLALNNLYNIASKKIFIALPIIGSLNELEYCYKEAGLIPNINNFPAPNINEMLDKKKFEIAEYKILDYHDSVLDLIRSITKIGAGLSMNHISKLTKNNLHELEKIYKKNFSWQNKIYTTWNIMEIVIEKC